MSEPPPARYRTTNWPSYNASLRKRGSLLIWVDKDMTLHAPRDGRPGRPAAFSDAAMQFCLSTKILFKLPLRQTAEMVASLLKLAGLDWSVPDFSTLCRRQKALAAQVPHRRADGPLNLRVDSPVLPDLLGQIPGDEQIATVTADGAYDTRRCHKALIARDAVPIIPIRKNGRLWKDDCPAARARNETLRATRYYGRAFRKRWTGYHARSRIEAKMRCLKAFGERIAASDPDRQTAEIHIRIALMNRFSALGTAEIIRVARQ
ncbi:transposase [Aquicoccus porphyridii]|uniref:Transposase n=2 Tax=Aquicoccus porphyridii TaxID=1852029 RepID=A0A5A9Z7F2_9RHOB|nr:transposase [Aquicoccus porphyridii]KAA0912992.1 transposase [Aquicoccus porphyridii]RAI54271.1 IS5/IS1182 family transposase [Rhodobacteraceae bacterium AsT-22]